MYSDYMKVSKEFTTITGVSKTIALLLFILLPVFAFILGMKYQRMLDWELLKSQTWLMK